jgi:hypothetical protein
MTFSFSSLSLSGVQAAAGVAVLPPGQYVCKVKDVEIADTKAKTGKVLKVKLSCEQGVITDNINVHNPNSEATRIGLEQLKGLLVSGGHPDPDNIGQHGVGSIKGLTVGVIVKADTYDGKVSSKVAGYRKPEEINSATPKSSAPAPAIGMSDSDIPFITESMYYDATTSKQRRMERYDY